VEANTITNKVEEEDSIACINAEMTESNDKDESTMPKTTIPKNAQTNEEEEGTKLSTPRT
jgi:hypothetical protein